MRMYHIALFFALVGAVTGMVDYIMIDAGGDNWYDRPVPELTVIELTESNVTELQFEEDSSNMDDQASITKYTNVLWNVVKGILGIVFILDDVLVWDVGGVNLFAPVLYSFQGILYVIYIIGSAQFILNRSTKGMN